MFILVIQPSAPWQTMFSMVYNSLKADNFIIIHTHDQHATGLLPRPQNVAGDGVFVQLHYNYTLLQWTL